MAPPTASEWTPTSSKRAHLGTKVDSDNVRRDNTDPFAVVCWNSWRQSHRFRLITLLNSNDTAPRTVRETRTDHFGNEYQVDVEHSLAELNSRYSNVRATGVPVQCWPELCDEISRTMTFVPKMSLEEMADNRYVMDVDGNAYVLGFANAPPETATHTSRTQVLGALPSSSPVESSPVQEHRLPRVLRRPDPALGALCTSPLLIRARGGDSLADPGCFSSAGSGASRLLGFVQLARLFRRRCRRGQDG